MPDSVSFDRAASYYDATRGFPPGVDAEVARLFVRASAQISGDGNGGLSSSSRVLEIGIGTGRIAVPLVPHVGTYTGIDISTAMMGVLRTNAANAGLQKPIRLVQGDATRLPFAAGAFDAAIAVHVFHLIGDPVGSLNELARVLRSEKNGRGSGYLLHGWNTESKQDDLRDLWNRLSGNSFEAIENRRKVFDQAGWTAVGEVMEYRFPVFRAPQGMLDAIRGRIWSACWRLSDEQLAEAERIMGEYIAEHYPDPTQPIEREGGFAVQVFTPPM